MWAIANFCCSKTLLFLHPGRVTGWACFLPHQRDYHGHVYNHSFSRSPSVSLLQSYFTYPRHSCNSFIFNPSFVFQGYLKCGSSDFQKYLATSPSKHQKSSSVKQCKTKHLLLFIQTSSMTTYKQKKKNQQPQTTHPNQNPRIKISHVLSMICILPQEFTEALARTDVPWCQELSLAFSPHRPCTELRPRRWNILGWTLAWAT